VLNVHNKTEENQQYHNTKHTCIRRAIFKPLNKHRRYQI